MFILGGKTDVRIAIRLHAIYQPQMVILGLLVSGILATASFICMVPFIVNFWRRRWKRALVYAFVAGASMGAAIEISEDWLFSDMVAAHNAD